MPKMRDIWLLTLLTLGFSTAASASCVLADAAGYWRLSTTYFGYDPAGGLVGGTSFCSIAFDANGDLVEGWCEDQFVGSSDAIRSDVDDAEIRVTSSCLVAGHIAYAGIVATISLAGMSPAQDLMTGSGSTNIGTVFSFTGIWGKPLP